MRVTAKVKEKTRQKILAAARITERGLREGAQDFDLSRSSHDDIASYDSDPIPRGALAIGRVGVEFGSDLPPSDRIDPEAFFTDGAYESTTNQLRWSPGAGSSRGYFTIGSRGTKAAVGFLPDAPLDCDGLWIHGRSGFAAIYVSSIGRDRGIADADQVLITAVARARDAGVRFRASTGTPELEMLGSADQPILMEPVIADVRFARSDIEEVVVLDHEGVPTSERLDHEDATIRIDGRRDRTMYYLVRFGD